MVEDTENILQKICLIEGDITEAETEAIVNAANNDLILGGGVAGAIRRKGGNEIQTECNKIGSIPIGEAALTTAGNLKARYVIHAASMSLGGWTSEQSLKDSTYNSLCRAKEHNVKSIAFPAIGTGVAGFPLDHCVQIMFDTIIQFLKTTPSLDKVSFVLYDRKTYETFKEYYDSLCGTRRS